MSGHSYTIRVSEEVDEMIDFLSNHFFYDENYPGLGLGTSEVISICIREFYEKVKAGDDAYKLARKSKD